MEGGWCEHRSRGAAPEDVKRDRVLFVGINYAPEPTGIAPTPRGWPKRWSNAAGEFVRSRPILTIPRGACRKVTADGRGGNVSAMSMYFASRITCRHVIVS